MKIVVLDGFCLNPGDLSWDSLRTVAPLEVYDRTSESLIVERAAGAEIVLTNKVPLGAATLAQLPELKYIGVLATGYNIVDVAAAGARGVIVCNIPTYGTASVAQFAFALLLELCHHVGAHSEAVRHGEWSRSADWSFWNSPLIELAGKTLGIVGLGGSDVRRRRLRRHLACAWSRMMRYSRTLPAIPDLHGFRWSDC